MRIGALNDFELADLGGNLDTLAQIAESGKPLQPSAPPGSEAAVRGAPG